MTIEVVWSRGREWCTRACAECEVPSSSPNMDAFLSSPRFASVPRGDGKLWLTMVPLHPTRPRTQQLGSYYGHAQVGFPRWSTPYPFFFQLKKKKFARLYKVEVYIHFDHRRSDFLREKKKVREMELISFVKFIIFMKGYYWYFLPINYCLGSP